MTMLVLEERGRGEAFLNPIESLQEDDVVVSCTHGPLLGLSSSYWLIITNRMVGQLLRVRYASDLRRSGASC